MNAQEKKMMLVNISQAVFCQLLNTGCDCVVRPGNRKFRLFIDVEYLVQEASKGNATDLSRSASKVMEILGGRPGGEWRDVDLLDIRVEDKSSI